ncbi:hypothetical protein AUR64_04540 [Haloprofundus marisrubri]|uniref:Uncharacterized protein n=1 Tax=Haloprofundus marisrubri TaxID=1514971 RepID=A0A0W1RD69_9EURY|nr:hypothetical protein [Haloprofundus marisrubri]KTG11202.1 hypothetical protein AUR64_04540 [Haloprofundus marisrubri]
MKFDPSRRKVLALGAGAALASTGLGSAADLEGAQNIDSHPTVDAEVVDSFTDGLELNVTISVTDPDDEVDRIGFIVENYNDRTVDIATHWFNEASGEKTVSKVVSLNRAPYACYAFVKAGSDYYSVDSVRLGPETEAPAPQLLGVDVSGTTATIDYEVSPDEPAEYSVGASVSPISGSSSGDPVYTTERNDPYDEPTTARTVVTGLAPNTEYTATAWTELDTWAMKEQSDYAESETQTFKTGDVVAPEPETEHRLVIGGSSDVSYYRVTTTGSLEQTTETGDAPFSSATVDDEDYVSGSSACGGVAGGADAYVFTGELTNVGVDGAASVYLDGEEIDPADYADELPHHLAITGGSDLTEYAFRVSGDVIKTTEVDGTGLSLNPSYDDEDTVSAGQGAGATAGGTDAYRFSSPQVTSAEEDISFTQFDGDATVYLNGEEIDPADY